MDRQSIRGYARATRALYDALCEAKGEANVPVELVVHAQENPKRGLAEITHLVMANDLMDDALGSVVSEALWDVDSEDDADLTIEEQGDFLLDWFKARGREAGTLTVPEAATELGVSHQAIRHVIETDPAKLAPGRVLGYKPKGRWLLDRDSFEAYKEWRASRVPSAS